MIRTASLRHFEAPSSLFHSCVSLISDCHHMWGNHGVCVLLLIESGPIYIPRADDRLASKS
jgi:hypothetical protein